VFTARYALSPYIKQIRFVFKGLIFSLSPLRAVGYMWLLTVVQSQYICFNKCRSVTQQTRGFALRVHPDFVLRPSYVSEKVDVNWRGVNQKLYSHRKQKQEVTVMDRSQPKGVQPKNERAQIDKWCKFATGVLKRRKTNGCKTRDGCMCPLCDSHTLSLDTTLSVCAKLGNPYWRHSYFAVSLYANMVSLRGCEIVWHIWSH
jgi:hypothetical protein